MRKTFSSFIFILIAIIINSCGEHRYPSYLVMADSLCDTNPDSALSMLYTIGKDSAQMPEADLMYWRLLRIKAADKAYIPFTSDSAAVAVMRYYENGGDRALLPTAYYYAGRASADIGDAPQALDYYQKALDVIKYNRYKRLEGLIHSQMGYIFSMQNLYSQAQLSWTKALETAKKEEDVRTIEYSLRDLGDSYINSNQYDSAYSCYSQALNVAKKQSDKFFEYDLYSQIAYLKTITNDFDSALYNIRKSLLYYHPVQESSKTCIAALLFEKMGKIDSAYYYFNKLNYCGNIYGKENAYRWLSMYYSEKNMSDSACKYTALYGMILDSISHIYAIETTARMNALYNYQIKEKENLHLKNVTQAQSYLIIIITLITISVIGFSIVLFLYSRQRKKKYELKIEKYQNIINDYKNNQEKEILKIKTINDYDIVKYIHNTLINPDGPNRMSNKHWEQLSDAVNEVYPNFNSRLNDLCRMNQFTTRICHLIKIGVLPKDMAILTNHSTSAITSVRKRLYEKAFNKKGTPSDWDEIVRAIS